MTNFTVKGPFVVPVEKKKAGRIVRASDGVDFFKQNNSFADKVGCYIFAIRAGGGITPVYVGKTTNRFDKECFTPHKLGKYNEGLASYQKGTPVMFFVVLPSKRGKNNNTHIGKLETFLIQTARTRNPELMNVQGVAAEDWSITGYIRSSQGKPTKATKEFKKMFREKK